MKIAAVLACYNRREMTLACLHSLLGQSMGPDRELSVYLLDDGSSDGTGEAVRAQYPEVTILEGDGQCFWNGGMHAAFGAAIKEGHDFYLWLNDDVELYDGFLARLLTCYDKLAAQQGPEHIIIGAVRDPHTGELTYSGMKSVSNWHPMKFAKLAPHAQKPTECETMNGNCVLIPATTVNKTGNMDPAFTHAMGDMDYGFRAIKDGARLWIAPGYVGECAGNDKHQRWQNPAVPFAQRLKILNSSHGLPWREYGHLLRQRSPFLWPLFALMPYMKVLLSGGKWVALQRFKKRQTHG